MYSEGSYPQYGFGNIIGDLSTAATDIYDAFNTDANPSPVASVPYGYPYNAYPYSSAATPYGVIPAVDAYGNPINYNSGQPIQPAFWDNYYYSQQAGQTQNVGASSGALLIALLALVAFVVLK